MIIAPMKPSVLQVHKGEEREVAERPLQQRQRPRSSHAVIASETMLSAINRAGRSSEGEAELIRSSGSLLDRELDPARA